jgi:hypothetical protein
MAAPAKQVTVSIRTFTAEHIYRPAGVRSQSNVGYWGWGWGIGLDRSRARAERTRDRSGRAYREQVEAIMRTDCTRTRSWFMLDDMVPDALEPAVPEPEAVVPDAVPEPEVVAPVEPVVLEPLRLLELELSIVPVISTSWPTWLRSWLSCPSRM